MASGLPEARVSAIISELPELHIQPCDPPSSPSPSSPLEKSASIDLLTILSNSIITSKLTPYLPASSFVALSATSHSVRNSLSYTWIGVRYLDLSPIKRLCLDASGPVDNGG